MRHPHGETVVVHPWLEEAGRDRYNNPVPGWGEDILRPNCAVAPRVQTEPGDPNRTMVIDGFVIYDSFDSPVTSHDEVTVRGGRYQVDGEVARWANPFNGGKPGCEFTVRRVSG